MKLAGRFLTFLTAFVVVFASLQVAPAAASDDVVFEGGGFGHGRGMSQYGAQARALDGQSRGTILLSYYTDAPNTKVSTLGAGGTPALDNVFVSVRSDTTLTTLTVSSGGGPPSTMTITRIDSAGSESAELSAGDTIVIEDTTPADGSPRGCTATLTIGGSSVNWVQGSCDFDISLYSGNGLPEEVITATDCRTANCTFGYGETLHLLDNGSSQRCNDSGCHYDLQGGLVWEGFDIVVEASLDDYTRGIAEVPFSWEEAALQAQAVAARSYAASWVEATDHVEKGCFCDLINNSTRQVYAGWIGNRSMWPRWDAAALATNGLVLTHPSAPNGGFIRAEYSSSNGGITEQGYDNSLNPLPYFAPVVDPFSQSSINPFASWTTTVPAATFENAFGWNSGTLGRVEITSATASGKAKVITFTSTDGTTRTLSPNSLKSMIAGSATCIKGDGNPCNSAGPLPSYFFDVPNFAEVDRWWGADRYETAVSISEENFPSGADSVVIATGLNFPDALAAASFAHTIDAPVLLVAGGSVPAEVLAEVQRLSPTKIYILGGPVAVPQSAEDVLDDVAPVTRLAGADRYETAIQISLATHTDPVDTVFLASGTSFVEALVAGPVAAASGNAILLVPPTTLPSSLIDEITRLSPSTIVVVGGGTVVSQAVVDQLGAYADNVVSIAGSNRYATAALMSQYGFPSGAETVLVATGAIFPDALAGSGVAGKLHAPILLVQPGALPSVTAAELQRLKPDTVYLLGGPVAISPTVLDQIAGLRR